MVIGVVAVNFLKNMAHVFRLLIVLILTIMVIWYLSGHVTDDDPAERGTLVEREAEGMVIL